jgi:hypothetical protein
MLAVKRRLAMDKKDLLQNSIQPKIRELYGELLSVEEGMTGISDIESQDSRASRVYDYAMQEIEGLATTDQVVFALNAARSMLSLLSVNIDKFLYPV